MPEVRITRLLVRRHPALCVGFRAYTMIDVAVPVATIHTFKTDQELAIDPHSQTATPHKQIP